MDFWVKVLIAYLLGSIVGSLVVGFLKGGVDIRKSGSGNAGATNALRTQGPGFAAGVIIIDVVKGWFAAAVLPGLALPGVPPASGDLQLLLPLFASWLILVMVSGFIGLASIIAAMAMPVYLLMHDGPALTPALGFSLACAALVLYTHRGNVRRMREGTEPRSRKLWLFGRGRA